MKRPMLQTFLPLIAGALFLSTTPAGIANAQNKPPRFSQLQADQLTPAQRPLGDKILKVSSVGLYGPYNLLLRSPVMGERMFQLLDYLRFHTSVPRSLNEFAILIQARLWTSQLEWGAHYPMALKAGLPKAVADELKEGKRPTSMTPEEAAVYDFCMEASSKRGVSDATFRRARQFLSQQQLIDLTVLSGTYATLSMMLNMGEQGLPPGRTPPLKPLPSH